MSQEVKPGDRIRLVAVFNDPKPFMVQEEGIVIGISGHGIRAGHWKELDVYWDNYPKRSYPLVSPPDIVLVLESEEKKPVNRGF